MIYVNDNHALCKKLYPIERDEFRYSYLSVPLCTQDLVIRRTP